MNGRQMFVVVCSYNKTMKVQYWLVVSNNVWVYRSNKNKEQKTLSSVCFLKPAPFCGIGQGNMNRYCSDWSYIMYCCSE